MKNETKDYDDLPIISRRKLEQLQKQPIIEAQIWKSDDGKWIIHETRVVDIKPISYLKKVIGDEE